MTLEKSRLSTESTKILRRFPSSSFHLYTQVPAEHRHSGRDAGIQSHGCESIGLAFALIKRLYSCQVTVPFGYAQDRHGAGYRHPCRYDDTKRDGVCNPVPKVSAMPELSSYI
jgi:hypothetical protein